MPGDPIYSLLCQNATSIQVYVISKPCHLPALLAPNALLQVSASSLIRAFISADPECDAAQALQRTQASGEVADYRNTTTHLVQDHLFQLQCQAASEAAQEGGPLPAPLVVLLDGFPRTVRQALAFERL